MTATFKQMRIEDASPVRQRLLREAFNLLAGYDNDVPLMIGTNILVQAIAVEVAGDTSKIDELVDQISAALKEGCRAQIRRTQS